MAGADDAVGLPAARELRQRLPQVQVRLLVINDRCKLLQEACAAKKTALYTCTDCLDKALHDHAFYPNPFF